MCAAPAINIKLMNDCLWKTFGDNNEMVVNKRGRNIFPMLAYTIGNLEPTVMYTLSVRIMPMDQYKYRFENSSWVRQSINTEEHPVRVFMHSEGYKTGQDWMESGISFPSLKICNDRSSDDMIFIQPHQKYMPHIDVWQLSTDQQTAKMIGSYWFEETKFIAVTAYKSKQISELKKLTNKHAAGKRTRSESSEDENQPKKRKCQTTHESDATTAADQYPDPASLIFPHDPYNAANFFKPFPQSESCQVPI